MNNFSAMWDFPIMDQVTLEYANRIHPLMQKRVERLLDALKKDSKRCQSRTVWQFPGVPLQQPERY